MAEVVSDGFKQHADTVQLAYSAAVAELAVAKVLLSLVVADFLKRTDANPGT